MKMIRHLSLYLKKPVILLLRFYQLAISPHFPPSCKFYPTCSSYAVQAVEKYGALRGGFLGLKRLLRCHSFNPFDKDKEWYKPVP